jgi:hypothetical protein
LNGEPSAATRPPARARRILNGDLAPPAPEDQRQETLASTSTTSGSAPRTPILHSGRIVDDPTRKRQIEPSACAWH